MCEGVEILSVRNVYYSCETKEKMEKIEIVLLYVETHVVVTVLIFAGTIELKKPITVHFYCSLSASVVILSANERGHKINTKWPFTFVSIVTTR